MKMNWSKNSVMCMQLAQTLEQAPLHPGSRFILKGTASMGEHHRT